MSHRRILPLVAAAACVACLACTAASVGNAPSTAAAGANGAEPAASVAAPAPTRTPAALSPLLTANTVSGDVGAAVAEAVRRAAGFGFSGAVLAVHERAVVYAGGAGFADRDAHRPNTDRTLFQIGSLTKQLTAVAVLRLRDAGRLRLDDPLDRHLEGVPPDKRGITIAHLLRHTSGLPVAWIDQFAPTPVVTRDEVARRVLALDLGSAPGERFLYSNAGYQLLAAIVEKAAGRPYWDVVAEVFAHAGMTTAAGPSAAAGDRAADLAVGYAGPLRASGSGGEPAASWLPAGSSGAWASVHDLHAFYRALETNAVLSAASLAEMLTPGLDDYGYGVWIRRSGSGARVVRHGGDMWGYGAEATWYVDDGTLLVAMDNDRPNYSAFYAAITRGPALYALRGAAPEPLPDFRSVPVGELQRRAGRYELAGGGGVTLRLVGDALVATADGQRAVDALAYGSAPPPEGIAARSEAAVAIVDAWFAGREEPLAKALEGNVYDGDAARVADQLAGFRGRLGGFRAARVLGTAGGFYDPRLTTWLELAFERGEQPFQITWEGEQIWWTDVEVVGPAFWYLRPETDTDFVGYDLTSRTAIHLAFPPEHGGRRLVLHGSRLHATFERSAEPGPG